MHTFGAEGVDMNRMGKACSKDDIVIFQGSTAPLPNGIPAFIVQILNVCVSGCSISNIHISCGWFSSTQLINPRVFRRLYYGDCLVNNGEALGPGETLSFQYANTFLYPLSVSSVQCCWSTIACAQCTMIYIIPMVLVPISFFFPFLSMIKYYAR